MRTVKRGMAETVKPGAPSQAGLSLADVAKAVEDARAALLSRGVTGAGGEGGVADLLTLLDRCREYADGAGAEPIRTIHHFACIGGTLITKCLASMPNTQVLSEVDPLSAGDQNSNRRFFPTDLIGLARLSTRGADDALLQDIFIQGLKAIYQDCVRKGQRLIIRDHAHSHFCVGPRIPERPSLRAMIGSAFPCLSAIQVRHPLDSFLSLLANRWVHFEPGTLDEYCRRYIAFLDHYPSVRIFRYEDFIDRPEEVMEDMCRELRISYTPDFMDTFHVHRVSGDSGRSGKVIGTRPRRIIPEDVRGQLSESARFAELCQRLGYENVMND
jgi:hypothetical protein